MEITVYTKDNCQPCRAVKRKLDQKGVAFVELNTDSLPELREKLRAEGWMASPVVEARNADGTLALSFSGYRPDKLDELVGLLGGE